MRSQPHLDPEFTSCPKSGSWLAQPRSLGRLMILIAVLGLALGVYAEGRRPNPVFPGGRVVAFQPPRLAPRRPLVRPRDPSVIVARPGIDEAMIHTARPGIDNAMIGNPGRVARMPVLIVPKSGAGGPVPVPPDSPRPQPWNPRPR
ncbi:MAG: hypothetical protein ACP5XB_02905 [Isosphaeraceae bacterium]